MELIFKAFGTSRKEQKAGEVRWIAPVEGFYKVNVDGGSLGNPGKPGFGGLIRNWHGKLLGGFSVFCGITTNLNAELLAIFHGLDSAWKADYRAVVCESGSQMAFDLILKGVQSFHYYAPLINRIRDFMSMPWIMIVQHTLREGNFCADWLAKHGASMTQEYIHWE